MKNNYVIFFLVFSLLSCVNNYDISKIKKPVFGNLILGENANNFRATFDSLKQRGQLNYTSNSNYPYLKIEDFDGLNHRTNLFFPFIIFNADSIVIRIGFFVYSFNQQNPQILSAMEDRNLIPKINVDIDFAF